jgi:steroid delta-isomerase-like uncharacterized protein
MSTQDNKALVRRTLEEFYNQGNMDLADELFAPDFVNHDPAVPHSGDLETLKHQTVARNAGFPDGQTTIEDLIAEDDRVTKRWAYQGTHTAEWNGISPTGKRVTVTGITIYRIADGKIAECWWGYDVLGLLQQLGVAPLAEPTNTYS